MEQLQINQQKALLRLITRIRESLELDTIFHRTAMEVRQLLTADRVGVFRFTPGSGWNVGEFVSEAVAPEFPSALAAKVQDHCFGDQYAVHYQAGRVQAVADIHAAGLKDCHVQVLAQFQIRANLIVPVLQGMHLWGLLCVHQCSAPRQWQAEEIEFAQQVAEHLAIAIQQAELLEQTQRQLAASEALRESELKLQKLADHTPGMLYQFKLSPDGSVSFPYVSSGCRMLWEVEPEAVQADAKLITSLIHSEDLPNFQQSVGVSAQTLQPWEWIGRIITRSGNQKWIQGKSRPERLENGDIVWHGFAEDISESKRLETDRKQAEAALGESEAKFRRLVEGANHLIYAIAADGTFTYLSPQFTAILGYELSAFLGKPFAQLVHPDDELLMLATMQQLFARGESQTGIEFRTQHQDGSWIWISCSNSPIKDAEGTVIGFQGIAQDVSDRKAAEAALQQKVYREQLLNRLTTQIRSSLDFNAILTTALDEIRSFLQIDSCTFTWCSLEAKERYWDCISESRDTGIPSYLGRYPLSAFGSFGEKLLNLEMIQVDDITTTADPAIRQTIQAFKFQAALILPMQFNPKLLKVISCYSRRVRHWTAEERDILQIIMEQLAIALNQANLYEQSQTKAKELASTLQKLQHTQSQLVQSEKMSSLGQLVAGIAHEINNPVNFIHGNVAHIETYIRDLLDLIALYQSEYPQPKSAIADKIDDIDLEFLHDDLPKLLSSMQVGTDRIREIVRSLRIFSRLDEAEVKAVDIHDGIDSTLLILQNRLKARSDCAEITIVKHYTPLPLVECFAGQLNQVFMNIIANALDALEDRDRERTLESTKHTPSTITIATALESEQWVVIRIGDNGPGIPESVCRRLFDPFFTTKPVGKGTGMGLSISYQIVTEKHRGTLICHSTPGQGTEFVIRIPLQQSMSL